MRLLFFLLLTNYLYSQITPLPNAHAHNDYEHPRPLLDALAQGFTSVEADVHLIDGELYVAHDRPNVKDSTRTLKNLYLKPLQKIIKKNNGTVYNNYNKDFFFMIDIKADAEGSYAVLKKQLKPFKKTLTLYKNGKKKQGAVTIFLSGARPIETVKNEKRRFVGIDGRPGDVGKYDANLMPVISDSYWNMLKWRGEGEMPAEEFEKLKKLTDAAHQNNQQVRLWATPESENVWKTLLAAGVDLLNTDQLERLKNFLLK
jgi:glycerophosphoryl diester phosphodiesterase